MEAALDVLEPTMVGDQEREVVGRVLLGTVEDDTHEIGKTLVGTMLIANGFKVFDIGVYNNAGLVGASALLTTTMLKQRELIGELEKAELRDR
jgi:trimethylamine corrinoid protein